jgi:hypothetical protein
VPWRASMLSSVVSMTKVMPSRISLKPEWTAMKYLRVRIWFQTWAEMARRCCPHERAGGRAHLSGNHVLPLIFRLALSSAPDPHDRPALAVPTCSGIRRELINQSRAPLRLRCLRRRAPAPHVVHAADAKNFQRRNPLLVFLNRFFWPQLAVHNAQRQLQGRYLAGLHSAVNQQPFGVFDGCYLFSGPGVGGGKGIRKRSKGQWRR